MIFFNLRRLRMTYFVGYLFLNSHLQHTVNVLNLYSTWRKG